MVDASAVVAVLVAAAKAPALHARLRNSALHAPHLLDVEVLHALRGLVRRGKLAAATATSALQDFDALALQRHAHAPLRARIWGLRDNLSAYDAAYVALAEALDAPLVTADVRTRDAPGHRASVEVYDGSW